MSSGEVKVRGTPRRLKQFFLAGTRERRKVFRKNEVVSLSHPHTHTYNTLSLFLSHRHTYTHALSLSYRHTNTCSHSRARARTLAHTQHHFSLPQQPVEKDSAVNYVSSCDWNTKHLFNLWHLDWKLCIGAWLSGHVDELELNLQRHIKHIFHRTSAIMKLNSFAWITADKIKMLRGHLVMAVTWAKILLM